MPRSSTLLIVVNGLLFVCVCTHTHTHIYIYIYIMKMHIICKKLNTPIYFLILVSISPIYFRYYNYFLNKWLWDLGEAQCNLRELSVLHLMNLGTIVLMYYLLHIEPNVSIHDNIFISLAPCRRQVVVTHSHVFMTYWLPPVTMKHFIDLKISRNYSTTVSII